MWKTKKNNLICGYLEDYENQKKHIERVLSAKDMTKSTIPPYKPKFLQLKLCKQQMEEDKNDKIKEENKILLYKIIKAGEKPSNYSRIYEPKKCPAFDKDFIHFKRIKKEIQNYKENIRFYNKIENVRSYYENDELRQRNKNIDENCKLLQKSIFDISPSLLFLSPSRIKKEIEKYKNLKMQRSNSTIMKRRPQSSYSRHNSSTNMRRIEGCKTGEKNDLFLNDGFLGPIQEDDEDKIKGNDNNDLDDDKNSKHSKKSKKSYSKNNSSINNSKKTNNTNKSSKSDKKQKSKSALKRNESEINLLMN
jgi:hypothetical protein